MKWSDQIPIVWDEPPSSSENPITQNLIFYLLQRKKRSERQTARVFCIVERRSRWLAVKNGSTVCLPGLILNMPIYRSTTLMLIAITGIPKSLENIAKNELLFPEGSIFRDLFNELWTKRSKKMLFWSTRKCEFAEVQHQITL
jgi:hypothetical protein